MTGYESKRAAAQDKLAQPAQEPVDDYIASIIAARDFLDAQPVPDSLYFKDLPQRTWVEPTESEWFEWWRVSQVADATEAEIDFADFLIIAQAVAAKLKEKNG